MATASDCAALFRSIVRADLAGLLVCQRTARSGNAEAVHGMRIQITRLRAAVRFFSPMVKDSQWRRLRTELRWVHRTLGAVRDADILLDHVARAPIRNAIAPGLERRLKTRSVKTRQLLKRALSSKRFAKLMTDLRHWIDGGPWSDSVEKDQAKRRSRNAQSYCARRIQRWHRKLVRRGLALRHMEDPRRHRFRIRVKHLRYMAETLANVVPRADRKPLRKIKRSARRLQGALGDLGDLKRWRILRSASALRTSGTKAARAASPKPEKHLLAAAIRAHDDLANIDI